MISGKFQFKILQNSHGHDLHLLHGKLLTNAVPRSGTKGNIGESFTIDGGGIFRLETIWIEFFGIRIIIGVALKKIWTQGDVASNWEDCAAACN